MKLKIIKTETENVRALERIAVLMDKPRRTRDETNELELLSLLVENFERTAYPMGEVDAVEMVKFVMEQRSLTRKDLEKELSSKSRVSDFLNRKRPLSANAMRHLHKNWKIPAEALLS